MPIYVDNQSDSSAEYDNGLTEGILEKGEIEKCRQSHVQEQESRKAGRWAEGKQEVSRSQQTGETDRKTEREAGGPRDSSLSPQGLEELPEMQVDPILGHQHNSWSGDRDPEGIWCQLKAEQGQGHRHLQLVHGKVLPNAVPGSGREKEVRSGLKAPARSSPFRASLHGPSPDPFPSGHMHISTPSLALLTLSL